MKLVFQIAAGIVLAGIVATVIGVACTAVFLKSAGDSISSAHKTTQAGCIVSVRTLEAGRNVEPTQAAANAALECP